MRTGVQFGITLALTVAGSLLTGWNAHRIVDARAESSPTGEVRVIDGDTIAIGRERIRLNGIDAPELHGCPPGRRCYVGPDPQASRASLAMGLSNGPLTVNRLKRDRYGRTVAQVKAGDTDLSCWQVESGMALYRPDWDEGNIMDGSCE